MREIEKDFCTTSSIKNSAIAILFKLLFIVVAQTTYTFFFSTNKIKIEKKETRKLFFVSC